MNIEKDVVITENTPRPFLEIPKLWLQLNKMSEDFFRQEIVHTSAKNTLLGVLIDTGVATAISVLFSILSVAFSYSTQPSSLINNILVISILFSCGQIFLVPVGFYFNVAITFISALIFGGKGTFNSQAYLESLFTVPLGLISSVFIFAWLIPSIGNYVVYIWLFGIMSNCCRLSAGIVTAHSNLHGRNVSADGPCHWECVFHDEYKSIYADSLGLISPTD